MKKINIILFLCAVSVGVQAQTTIIDTLTGHNTGAGNLIGYTPYLVNDVSAGAGQGVSFPGSPSGLSATYLGTGTTAEQALFLAPLNNFSTTFAVGDILTVNVAVPASSTQMDFGLAVAAANPVAASSGNSYNSRTLFDWASISVRPSQSAIRANTSISGTLTTGNGVANIGSTANITQLFIWWNSADVFSLGYVSNSVQVIDETVTFAPSSTIGAEIGFYGDLRATGASLGNFSNLAIVVPEPTSLAICGMGGLLGLAGWMRRKK